MSQQTCEQFRDERLNADLDKNEKMDLKREYEARQGKYIHVPIYHPSHVSITHASYFSIALSALISLYISYLISPSRLLLSV
jgi:hypothetical protein